jgi:hypothetical protein
MSPGKWGRGFEELEAFMKVKDVIKMFGLAIVLVGLSACASVNHSGSGTEPAVAAKEAPAIKLPDSLYCTRTAVEDRLTVNLAPLKEALENPDEVLEVFISRSGHEIGSLGQVGGGAHFQDWVFINLAPADAAVFDSSPSVRFTLKVVNGKGETLVTRPVTLMMN